jgi:signal transduction histidine kinase
LSLAAGVGASAAPSQPDQLDRFAGLLVHQLGESVALIEGYAALLEETPPADLSGDQAAALAAIRGATRRVRRVNDDLLDLTGLAARAPRPEPVEAREALGPPLARLRGEPAATLVRVEVGELPRVRADPAQLKGLMRHLLCQAIAAATAGGGNVRVTGARDGNRACLDVADDGPPVTHAGLAELFELGARPRAGGPLVGAGIGLAIARAIVAAHGGRIWARPGTERGLTISFTLPAA